MYCAACGAEMASVDKECRHCGMPVEAVVPPMTEEAADLDVFAKRLRQLGIFWYLFAVLNVALGVVGLFMLQIGATQIAGTWEPWPHPPGTAWMLAGKFGWSLVAARVLTAVVAGFGLRARAEWGRGAALLASLPAITQFPIGLLLGCFTAARLLGRRSAALYARLV